MKFIFTGVSKEANTISKILTSEVKGKDSKSRVGVLGFISCAPLGKGLLHSSVTSSVNRSRDSALQTGSNAVTHNEHLIKVSCFCS